MSRSAPWRYRERLWPSAGVWLAVVGVSASLGVIALPLSAAAAITVAAAGTVLSVTLLIRAAALVAVQDGDLVAGRARVPLRALAEVRTLPAEAMSRARGRELDARAYLCLRGWLPAGVMVRLDDPDDPTPYWLISSRRPQALAAALREQPGGPSRRPTPDTTGPHGLP